jgi:hypothetical protein
MNPCCEHLFREAKRELEIRDKRIKELQDECTRLFEPTRTFWNMESQNRIESLIKENELCTDKIFELEDKSSVLVKALEKILSSRTCKTHKLGECPSAELLIRNLVLPNE